MISGLLSGDIKKHIIKNKESSGNTPFFYAKKICEFYPESIRHDIITFILRGENDRLIDYAFDNKKFNYINNFYKNVLNSKTLALKRWLLAPYEYEPGWIYT